jgi:membrane protein implicated in regulation of membrane protease activity
MNWSHEAQWLLWLAAALAATIIEVATVDFFFLMIAGGALITAMAAALHAGGPLQVIIFAASSIGLLLTVRPPMKRWAQSTPGVAMNTAALIGREARVLETVTERAGRVKLAGEVWSARVVEGQPSLEVGSDVHIVRIDGATAVVAPDPAPPAPNFLEGRPTP